MVILVTGGAGTVGGLVGVELLDRGHKVRFFDSSEDGLFRLAEKIKRSSPHAPSARFLVGDVRDADRVKRAVDGVDAVVHCAALKHVEMCEYNVTECVATNVLGVQNIVDACTEKGVPKCLFTSSDKAVNPTSSMGASKLLGEKIFVAANNSSGDSGARFACVRFGNILNSNGSVLTVFDDFSSRGMPLPITDLKMTRFFLSSKTAIDLILESLERMVGGEVFVRSMCASSIIELARAYFGRENIEYEIIGAKPGEKLYEELLSETESRRTVRKGDIYCVLPELGTVVFEERRQELIRVYEEWEKVRHPLRSDEAELDWPALRQYLLGESVARN